MCGTLFVFQIPEMVPMSLLESLMQSYQRRTRNSCGNNNHPTRGRIIILSTLPAIRMFSRFIPRSHFPFQMNLPTWTLGILPFVFIDSLSPIMSVGLDAHQIANERERFIEARIQQHIRELDAMPVHGGGILSAALRGH